MEDYGQRWLDTFEILRQRWLGICNAIAGLHSGHMQPALTGYTRSYRSALARYIEVYGQLWLEPRMYLASAGL